MVDAGNGKPLLWRRRRKKACHLTAHKATIPMDVIITPKVMFAMRSGERVIVGEGDARYLGLGFLEGGERVCTKHLSGPSSQR